MYWRGKATGAGDMLQRVTRVTQILKAQTLNAFRKTRQVLLSTAQLVSFLKCSHSVISVGLMRNISRKVFYVRKKLYIFFPHTFQTEICKEGFQSQTTNDFGVGIHCPSDLEQMLNPDLLQWCKWVLLNQQMFSITYCLFFF